VPTVHPRAFPRACDRRFVFAVDADDDGSVLLDRFLSPRADVTVDIDDASATELPGSVGQTASLVAVGGYAHGHPIGDAAVLARAEFRRRRSLAGDAGHFVPQERRDRIRRA